MTEIRSKFVRYKEGATLSRDDTLRFMDYSGSRSYGRANMAQAGYNAQNPSIMVRTIRLNTDNVNVPRK